MVGIEEVCIAEDENRVARGVGGDVVLQLLKVGRAGFFVALCGADLGFWVSD